METARSRMRFRWLTGLTGLCGLIVLWLLLATHSRPSGYRRFTSQPLPDGSRYTFLYPAYLRDIQENGSGASAGVTQNVSIYNRQVNHSYWELLGRWFGRPIAEPMEGVTVLVVPQKKIVADRRWSEEWERGLERRRNEMLMDRRTQSQFMLFYSCPHTAPAQFERNHKVIARSFEVLSPTP